MWHYLRIYGFHNFHNFVSDAGALVVDNGDVGSYDVVLDLGDVSVFVAAVTDFVTDGDVCPHSAAPTELHQHWLILSKVYK